MKHKNDMESYIYELERELKVAEMNKWEFDINYIKSEIAEAQRELEESIKEAWGI